MRVGTTHDPGSGEDSGGLRGRLGRIPHVDDRPIDASWAQSPREQPAPEPILRRHVVEKSTGAPERSNPRARPETPVWTERSTEVAREEPPTDWVDALPRRPRRRWLRTIVVLLLLAAIVAAVPVFLAWRTFNGIERLPIAEALDEPIAASPGRNVLLVGTDSRSGIEADVDNAGLILGGGTEGERSDTIMVLRLGDDGSTRFVSLPRDLWLPIDGGDPQRINTAIRGGPEALVRTVQDGLSVPIHHYVQVDLAGFIELVDAVGGVTITIPHPAFDRASGLDLPTAGPVRLDSAQALAWVRSRRYTEVIDGAEVRDPTSDLGRVQRQQEFMRALMAEVSAERNPTTLNSMMTSIADAVVLDDRTSLSDALGIAQGLRGEVPESVVLPTVPADVGGAAVLLLADGAESVLGQFG